MSQLGQLKGQINAISQDAKTTAGGLSSFKSKFSQAVGQVNATIGGSAQQIDKNMIATLQAAEKQVDAAVQALQAAASAANQYAASL
jgi:ABC-type transporter Mla subunit MlaD